MDQLLIAILGAGGVLLALACVVAWWEHHRRLSAVQLQLAVAECARLEWQRRAQALDEPRREHAAAAATASAAAVPPVPTPVPPTPPGQPRRPGQRPTVAPPRPLPADAGASATAVPYAAADAAEAASSSFGPSSLPPRWEDTQPMVLVPDVEAAASVPARGPATNPVATATVPPTADAATAGTAKTTATAPQVVADFAPTQPMDADAMWPETTWLDAMAPTQPMPLDLLPSPFPARRSADAAATAGPAAGDGRGVAVATVDATGSATALTPVSTTAPADDDATRPMALDVPARRRPRATRLGRDAAPTRPASLQRH